jgi:hypothetical protein
MRNHGVTVRIISQCFGSALKKAVQRAKVFLNVRFSDSTILETCRLHEALAQRDTHIVSEKPGVYSDDITIYGVRIHFVDKDNVIGLCSTIKSLLTNDKRNVNI